jgi:hypothetical protein
MRQLETLLSIAHMRHPNRTETLEAVSIAKHLLGKVGDQLDKAVKDDPEEWSDGHTNLFRTSLNP